MAAHHGAVGHELQQGAALAELVDGLLQVQEGLPFLQGPGQFAAPGSERGLSWLLSGYPDDFGTE